jgi:hypothetical protein
LAIIASLGGARVAPAAAQDPLVLEIPGLSAPRISVAGVQRLDDGGALIAATLSRRRASGRSRIALVRMLSDGSPDLAYGTLGISTPPIGDAEATALAVNPATAEAWIGLIGRRGDRGEIAAFDGLGRPVTRFGYDGLVGLRSGAPQAIAWRPGQLFVAMGHASCQGCTVALVNATDGVMGRKRQLAAGMLVAGSAPCTARSISDALFTLGGNVRLAVDAAGPGCAAGVDQASPAKLIATGTGLSVVAALGSTVRSDVLGAFGAQTCVGGTGSRGTAFGSLDSHDTVRTAFRGSSGEIVSVVALGHGACAILVRARGGGVVLQATPRQRVAREAVPRSIEPLGMFRCHQHMLIIGSSARGAGEVFVVPVSRGPYAGATAGVTARITASAARCV